VKCLIFTDLIAKRRWGLFIYYNKKILQKILGVKIMKKTRKWALLLAGALLLGTLGACAATNQLPPAQPQGTQAGTATTATPAAQPAETQPANTEDNTRPNGSLIIATQNETPSIAPGRHITMAGSYKNLMTHNGLFRTCYSTLETIPDLVESYRALSDVLFEFTLREGVLFHNGEAMTAYDVVASFFYVRSYPDARTAHISAVYAEVIDRYTFTIYTGEPNAGLFDDLAGQANFIMPKSLIEAGHDFKTDPVGSGPFVFDEWRAGNDMTFTAFPYYFDTERAARIEEVVWRFVPEASSRTIALETGEVDFIVEVSETDVTRLQDNSDITVFMREGTGFHFMLLNNSLPQFENIVVRQALNMAIDQEALVLAAFEGLAVANRSHLSPAFAGVTDEGVLPFDPEAARALLAEHDIDPATLAFDMIADTEPRRRIAEVVQAQVADLGITATITIHDHATTIQRSLDAEYEALFGMVTTSSLIPLIRLAYHGDVGGNPNRSRFNDPRVNELIDNGIATIDTEARNAVFEEASRLLNELVPNVPTHVPLTIRAFNSNLIVPEISASGNMQFNMAFWAQ